MPVSIGVGRLGWELDGNPGTLTELLAVRCTYRPLVILLDEAHTLDEDVGRALLNASQSATAAAPFLLALAGTPDLEPHLNAMSATFWNRAEYLGIGLLDEPAAMAALVRPLAEQEPAISFEDTALRRVLDDSQCYPYFIQLWGAALWDTAVQNGKTRIDETVVEQASLAFDPKKNTYYEHRRDELERRDLLPVAISVADAFAGRVFRV